jgi:hypothetical protein
MSNQEFADSLCKWLCELDRRIKTFLFGKAGDCRLDCRPDKKE